MLVRHPVAMLNVRFGTRHSGGNKTRDQIGANANRMQVTKPGPILLIKPIFIRSGSIFGAVKNGPRNIGKHQADYDAYITRFAEGLRPGVSGRLQVGDRDDLRRLRAPSAANNRPPARTRIIQLESAARVPFPGPSIIHSAASGCGPWAPVPSSPSTPEPVHNSAG